LAPEASQGVVKPGSWLQKLLKEWLSLGVGFKSFTEPWFDQAVDRLAGEVEMDETYYVGGGE
jgi:hypothetical protein